MRYAQATPTVVSRQWSPVKGKGNREQGTGVRVWKVWGNSEIGKIFVAPDSRLPIPDSRLPTPF